MKTAGISCAWFWFLNQTLVFKIHKISNNKDHNFSIIFFRSQNIWSHFDECRGHLVQVLVKQQGLHREGRENHQGEQQEEHQERSSSSPTWQSLQRAWGRAGMEEGRSLCPRRQLSWNRLPGCANSCAIVLYFPVVWIRKIFWNRKSSMQRLLGNQSCLSGQESGLSPPWWFTAGGRRKRKAGKRRAKKILLITAQRELQRWWGEVSLINLESS